MRPKRSQANRVRELGDVHATDNQRAATDRPQAVRDKQNAAKTNPSAPLGWTRFTDARIIENPEWLPHTFNANGDQLLFLKVPEERRRSAPFLSAGWLSDCSRTALACDAVDRASQRLPVVPIHFIFHTAFCGSTLLVRALDAAGAASGLVEPDILLNLHFRLSRSQDEAEQARLRMSLRLLGRPFKADAVIAKPSCVANPCAPLILENSARSKAVLLSSDLRTFLLAIAKRGPHGLAWGRRVFESCRESLPIEVRYTAEELARLSCLQVSALAWIARRALFENMLNRFGPERLLQLSSEQLFANPVGTVERAARFLGRELHAGTLEALALSDVLRTHSKTGRPFDLDARAEEQRMLSSTYGTQVDAVVAWSEAESARKVVLRADS